MSDEREISSEERQAELKRVEEEAEAAAAEAGRIGGDAPVESDDPSQQPLIEAGQGESEGFELAEARLRDIASHGDEHRFPDRDVGCRRGVRAGRAGRGRPGDSGGWLRVWPPPQPIASSRWLPTRSTARSRSTEIRRAGNGAGAEVRVVVPAVEASVFQHTLGDIDEPRKQAEERLGLALRALHDGGIEAVGEVGDPDPVQAAQDALLKAPADEVLIFEHESAQARWFEEGLFERAQDSLEPPLRMVVLHGGDPGGEHVVAVEDAGAGAWSRRTGWRSRSPTTCRRCRRATWAAIVTGDRRHDRRDRSRRRGRRHAGAVTGWQALAIGVAIASRWSTWRTSSVSPSSRASATTAASRRCSAPSRWSGPRPRFCVNLAILLFA